MKTRALLLVLVAWTLFAGCGDVESCQETFTPGCLNSAPDQGRCLFDLVVVDGKCVKPGTASVGGNGDCQEGFLYDARTKECVNFCANPPKLPGSDRAPEPIFCEAIATNQMPNPPMLTFAEVCTRRCRLRCQRLAQFCPGYTCPAGACDGADVQTECLSECPQVAGGNDLACLTLACNDMRFARCDSSIACPNGVAPNCNDITCNDDCTFGGPGVTGNGRCDDGDVFSSETAQCGWGTDCADCGPRAGRELLGGAGAVCEYTLNCEGGTGSPDTAGAWCVGLSSIANLARCAPDCSRSQACADGFECREALFLQPDGSQKPIVAGGYSSAACLPTACM